jgi:hypothetical protein
VRSAFVHRSHRVRSPFTKRSFTVCSAFAHKAFSVRSPFIVRSSFTKHSPFTIHIIIRNFNEKGHILIVRKWKRNVYVKVEGK